METLMIKSRPSFQNFLQAFNISTPQPPFSSPSTASTGDLSEASSVTEPTRPPQDGVTRGAAPVEAPPHFADSTTRPTIAASMPTMSQNHTLSTSTSKPLESNFTSSGNATNFTTAYAENTTDDYFPNYWTNSDDSLSWNSSYLANSTANYTSYNISDYELLNVSNSSIQFGFWFCAKWVDAQQDLFQAANLCFAVAFLIPKSFKQSILIMRALAAAGFLLLAAWAGTELCAPDVLAWNIVLVIVNSVHTVLLIIRFLPPALSLELTELFLRLFKPLKVSKKHFKELAREARLMRLEPGEPYAVEGVTPADERLSILLKGKLKVSCDQTHLHMIHPHQFLDSPEWEANHEQSDDVFQVTIVAEEGCTYICWPRMRLERVLRHRPMLKIVLDSLIGKDITHKLYSLNEQQERAGAEAQIISTTPILPRSLSADAVDVGARGRVRSLVWRARERRGGNPTDRFSPARAPQQDWRPVASQFPQHSPFISRAPPPPPRLPSHSQLMAQASSSSLPFPPATTPLLSPPKKTFRKTASFRKNREVKFAEPHDTAL